VQQTTKQQSSRAKKQQCSKAAEVQSDVALQRSSAAVQ
jgi:hypothetical protein